MKKFTGICVLGGLPGVIFAATPAWPGDTIKSFQSWQNRHAVDTLSYAVDYAVNAPGAVRLQSPPSKDFSVEHWPSISLPLGGVDWSMYDRLVVYTVNRDGANSFGGAIELGDGVKKEGFIADVHCIAGSLFANVIALDKAAKSIDITKVNELRLFAITPREGLDVTFSGFLLLKPGEALPELSAKSVKQLQGLSQARLDQAKKALKDADAAIDSVPNAEFKAKLKVEKATLANELAAAEKTFSEGAMSLAEYQDLSLRCYNFPARIERLGDNGYFASASLFYAADAPAAVGHTGVTDQLAPNAMGYKVSAAPEIMVSAGRNETEAFQMAVLPLGRDLNDVHVTVGDLKDAAGKVFPADAVTTSVVGAVEVKERTNFEADYVGFYADPVLDFMQSCAVPDRRLQSILVRVRVPEGQEPGEYRGTLSVKAGDKTLRDFSLRLTVWPFVVPAKAALPTAFTFFKRDQIAPYWEDKKLEYADFLASYHLDFDNLYRKSAPDFEILERQREQGVLSAFNLCNVFNTGLSPESLEKEIPAMIERVRPIYEEAKKRGLLEYAYFYGFDECPAAQFDNLEKVAATLKKEFPGVPVMTTAFDHSYGLKTGVKSIDIWCPLTPMYFPEQAAEVRKDGHKVWWYVCCVPYEPYPNFLIENHPGSARMLAGAMAAKFRPDGLLYYSMNEWWDRTFIGDGPITDWDATSYPSYPDDGITYHGDGMLLYPDAEGNLMASLRLENIRDGLDDLFYIHLAEARLADLRTKAELTAAEKMWIARAEQLLPIPEAIVKSKREYANDRELIAYRNALGMLLADDPQWEQK